jgi:hypothetical protein
MFCLRLILIIFFYFSVYGPLYFPIVLILININVSRFNVSVWTLYSPFLVTFFLSFLCK